MIQLIDPSIANILMAVSENNGWEKTQKLKEQFSSKKKNANFALDF